MTTASSIQADNLASKRALVTGGTRGTGAAVAARLKGAGAQVTAIGRHAVEHLAADEFVPADITTGERMSPACARVAAIRLCPMLDVALCSVVLEWGLGRPCRRHRMKDAYDAGAVATDVHLAAIVHR